MIRRLARDGAGIQVVVGPPGTGKTFALAAAREAWEASGFTVLGAAVARRAAVELTSSAGIEATSVSALLLELKRGPPDLLDERTVLVVDEAGTLGTRALAEIVERTRPRGTKLVLVGDPEQLPEIEAGGAFRALAARTTPIVLETNRRQRRIEDRRMLDAWRSGDLRAALTIAIDSGDLVLDASPEEAVDRLVADYTDAVARGDDAIMLAPRRSEVRLSERARPPTPRGGRSHRRTRARHPRHELRRRRPRRASHERALARGRERHSRHGPRRRRGGSVARRSRYRMARIGSCHRGTSTCARRVAAPRSSTATR